MHLCAAKCCEDRHSSIDLVQGCVERCSGPMTKAQRYVHTEVEEFQGRLQRCVMVRCLPHGFEHSNQLSIRPAMQRRRQSANAAAAERIGYFQVHRPIRALRHQVRGQADRSAAAAAEIDEIGAEQRTQAFARCVNARMSCDQQLKWHTVQCTLRIRTDW